MTPNFDNLASLLMEVESPEERRNRIKDIESRGYGKSKRIPMTNTARAQASRDAHVDDDLKQPIIKVDNLKPARDPEDDYYYTKAFRDMLEPRTRKELEAERKLERKEAAADRQRARLKDPAYLARKKKEREIEDYNWDLELKRRFGAHTRRQVKQFGKEIQRLEHVDQDKRL